MCRQILPDFKPDETTTFLFDVCDALMDALEAAERAGDKESYKGIKNLLVQTAALIDAKANTFKARL